MTVLELIDELKRYDNDYVVLFKEMREATTKFVSVDFTNSPEDKKLTLEFYG